MASLAPHRGCSGNTQGSQCGPGSWRTGKGRRRDLPGLMTKTGRDGRQQRESRGRGALLSRVIYTRSGLRLTHDPGVEQSDPELTEVQFLSPSEWMLNTEIQLGYTENSTRSHWRRLSSVVGPRWPRGSRQTAGSRAGSGHRGPGNSLISAGLRFLKCTMRELGQTFSAEARFFLSCT